MPVSAIIISFCAGTVKLEAVPKPSRLGGDAVGIMY